ncbi:hypothetical protein G3I71_46880, partial [Streptomyces sp. SID12501]|nr:hypothetical protein [Streptomyces sp. SID12501]
ESGGETLDEEAATTRDEMDEGLAFEDVHAEPAPDHPGRAARPSTTTTDGEEGR